MIELIDEIDCDKTVDAVMPILHSYKRLRLIADEDYQPKITASWSLSISAPTNQYINPLDEHLSRTDEANCEIIGIMKAVNKLSYEDKRYIIDGFISKDDFDYNIYKAYNMSERQYYRNRRKAIFHFALAYRGGKKIVFGRK